MLMNPLKECVLFKKTERKIVFNVWIRVVFNKNRLYKVIFSEHRKNRFTLKPKVKIIWKKKYEKTKMC